MMRRPHVHVTDLHLLPRPRRLVPRPGFYELPAHCLLHLEASLPRDTVLLPLAEQLKSAGRDVAVEFELITGPVQHPRLAITAQQDSSAPNEPDSYSLRISKTGIAITYRLEGGLRAAIATLRQLLRQCGRRLPCLEIRDHADFPRRGVMLDISRGRVPNLQTLFDLVDHLADFKINEFQLYTEHTFAYRNYEPVWRKWGALTGEEILKFDARCRRLGIDLVPNQNSFGHLRYWLEYAPLKKLAEVNEPYEGSDGTFLRYPTTLAPNHPGTLPFLRGLYDELLPHFSSRFFNVGCDETWDLGRGQSKTLCDRLGKGRVYIDFLKRIHKEVQGRGRQLMFWGDIILHYPEFLKGLPKDSIALNWGYEADHPFDKETRAFARSGMPFYVCPGTSTWMTLVGRHDNALTNLRAAADAGKKQGALGFLNTDWGDGGHPQPLAVSYLPFLAGAALSWCASSYDSRDLVPVLNRDVFADPTDRAGTAALAMGLAHHKFRYTQPNVTPFGAVIAAPLPKTREIPCRDGLKYFARIPRKNVVDALDELEAQRQVLYRARPTTHLGDVLTLELDLAARMAAQSCHYMLWQQALAAGNDRAGRQFARRGVRALREIDHDFRAYWPLRNKGTTEKCSPFLRWRVKDYLRYLK